MAAKLSLFLPGWGRKDKTGMVPLIFDDECCIAQPGKHSDKQVYTHKHLISRLLAIVSHMALLNYFSAYQSRDRFFNSHKKKCICAEMIGGKASSHDHQCFKFKTKKKKQVVVLYLAQK